MNSTPEILFAPLQGYTESEYRRAHHRIFGGVDMYYMPFVRLEHNRLLKRDVRQLDESAGSDVPVTPQIIASSPEEARTVISEIQNRGFKSVNINMGCPFPPLAYHKKGAGILPYPERVREVLDAAFDAAQGMELSVKMRLGWEEPAEAVRLLPIINTLPLANVTMHPRLGKQGYKGEPDMEGFSYFYNECAHPLYYNGDILTSDHIAAIISRYPRLRGVMIGRGLLANPALGLETKQGGTPMDYNQKIQAVKRLHDEYYRACESRIQGGDLQIIRKMQAFWEYLLPEVDRKAHKAIRKASNLTAYHRAVNQLLAR